MNRTKEGRFMPYNVDWSNAVERECVVCSKEIEVLPKRDEETGGLIPVPDEMMCWDCIDEYYSRRSDC